MVTDTKVNNTCITEANNTAEFAPDIRPLTSVELQQGHTCLTYSKIVLSHGIIMYFSDIQRTIYTPIYIS